MTEDDTGSAARTVYWEKAESVLFGWILPLAFVVGTLTIVNGLDKAGQWDEFTVLAMGAGCMAVVGGQALGHSIVEVFGLAQ